MRRSEISSSWVLRWERRGVVSFLEGRKAEDGDFVGVAGFGACGGAGREISRIICVLLTKKSSQRSKAISGGLPCDARIERAW